MSHRILIADDEPNIVISLEYLLKKEGFEIAVATDGEAVLRLAGEFRPELVLLDIMMPKKSGFEVCEALRADPAQANLKIIMLSTLAQDADIEEGTRAGADRYITKPFNPRELYTIIRDL